MKKKKLHYLETNTFPFKKGVNYKLIKYTPSSDYSYTRHREGEHIIHFITESIPHVLCDLTVCDGCANIGSNSILFGLHVKKVVSVEVDENNYIALQHNVSLYKLNNISIYKKNIKTMLTHKFDLLFLSIPIRRNYKEFFMEQYDLTIDGISLSDIVEEAVQFGIKYIVCKIPFNYDIRKLKFSGMNMIAKRIFKFIILILSKEDLNHLHDELSNILNYQQLSFVNEFGERLNNIKMEFEEQKLALKYIKPDDCVLELGARYGSVSCVTNMLLSNKRNQVSIEPDKTILKALKENKKRNGCKFKIMEGVLSNDPLCLIKRENSQWNGYDAFTMKCKDVDDTFSKSEVKKVKTYSLMDLNQKYNFNVLIADCEGCLPTFYKENPEFFYQLRMIIFEKDYINKYREDYIEFEKELSLLGFIHEINGLQNVFIKLL